MSAERIIFWMYFISLALLAAALPLSMFMMSVAQFALVGVMIVDGMNRQEALNLFQNSSPLKVALLTVPLGIWWIFKSIAYKLRNFFARDNIPAIIFCSIYFIHAIGLLYTEDINYALKDLRIKSPLVILPVVLSTTGKLNRLNFRHLMGIFIAGVIAATLITGYYYFTRDFSDVRNISVFISHIRFSLMICISVYILMYWITRKNQIHVFWKAVSLAAMIWMIIYLIMVTSITGIVIIMLTGFILVIYIGFQPRRKLFARILLLTGSLIIPFMIGWYVFNIMKDVYHVDPVDLKALDQATASGNPYFHDTINGQVENGHYVWIYLAENELREAWNSRSDLRYDSLDLAGQEIKYTLIRFLSSKGYRKDADGVQKLTEQEIRMIEEGTASVVYELKNPIYVRIYQIIWEYKRYQETGNPSGHSVMQRFEYWKASWGIIKDHWFTGVGTGDLNAAYTEQYQKMGTQLDDQFRWRAHNQFLAILVGLGFMGLAFFLLSLLYPPLYYRRFSDYYYLTFFVIIVLSMLPEDTLETQAGLTLYAFFSSVYLFAKSFHDPV